MNGRVDLTIDQMFKDNNIKNKSIISPNKFKSVVDRIIFTFQHNINNLSLWKFDSNYKHPIFIKEKKFEPCMICGKKLYLLNSAKDTMYNVCFKCHEITKYNHSLNWIFTNKKIVEDDNILLWNT